MRVPSYTTDESSLENKAPDPNNSATRSYSLTAFSVPLLPRPHILWETTRPVLIHRPVKGNVVSDIGSSPLKEENVKTLLPYPSLQPLGILRHYDAAPEMPA